MTIIVMVQKVEDLLGQETSPLHHIEKHTILGFSESGPSWTQAPETLIFGKKLDLLVNSGRFAAYAPPPLAGPKGLYFYHYSSADWKVAHFCHQPNHVSTQPFTDWNTSYHWLISILANWTFQPVAGWNTSFHWLFWVVLPVEIGCIQPVAGWNWVYSTSSWLKQFLSLIDLGGFTSWNWEYSTSSWLKYFLSLNDLGGFTGWNWVYSTSSWLKY